MTVTGAVREFEGVFGTAGGSRGARHGWDTLRPLALEFGFRSASLFGFAQRRGSCLCREANPPRYLPFFFSPGVLIGSSIGSCFR